MQLVAQGMVALLHVIKLQATRCVRMVPLRQRVSVKKQKLLLQQLQPSQKLLQQLQRLQPQQNLKVAGGAENQLLLNRPQLQLKVLPQIQVLKVVAQNMAG